MHLRVYFCKLQKSIRNAQSWHMKIRLLIKQITVAFWSSQQIPTVVLKFWHCTVVYIHLGGVLFDVLGLQESSDSQQQMTNSKPSTPCPTCIVVFLSRSESWLLQQRGSFLPRFGESALILTSPPERVAARGFSPEAAVRPPEEDHGPMYIFWGLPIWHRRLVSLTFFLACFLWMKLRLILSVLYSLSISCVQSQLLAVNPHLWITSGAHSGEVLSKLPWTYGGVWPIANAHRKEAEFEWHLQSHETVRGRQNKSYTSKGWLTGDSGLYYTSTVGTNKFHRYHTSLQRVTDHYIIKHRTYALGSDQYENRKRRCKKSCPGNIEKETMSLKKNLQELETTREKLREIKVK